MSKKIYVFLLVIILIIILISCKRNKIEEKNETIFAVDTTKAIKGEINV